MSRAKFFKSNRTHVIELYCYSDEYTKQAHHEIISGADSGPVLTDSSMLLIRKNLIWF